MREFANIAQCLIVFAQAQIGQISVIFVALARYGSLSATARVLRVNHATVARRLAGLEQALGAKLFERRPTGYVLTAAGRQALEPASTMEDAAGTLGRIRFGIVPTGLVRITATPSLAETFLTPRLDGAP